MSFNLSALFERVVAVAGDRVAIAAPARTLTYAELDARANQLARALAAQGVTEGSRIGLYLLNGTEYLEGMLALFKLRATPININHRYVARELAYIAEDAELTGAIIHHRFLPVWEQAGGSVASTLVVADETGKVAEFDYETALAAESGSPLFADGSAADERSGDDVYIVYTGGTTGMPKGVMWRHEDLFFAALGGGDPLLDKGHLTDPDELGSRVPEWPITQLVTPPLMHVSAHWGAFNTFFGGGKVVLMEPGTYQGSAVWDAVAAQGVNAIVVVGDAMARPALEALEARENRDGLESLLVFASGGAVLSGATKAEVKRLLPNVILVDTFGSSETGVVGTRSGDHEAGVRFTVDAKTAVLDDDGNPVAPGPDENGEARIGRLARFGHLPLGYLNDEAKSAKTFITYQGKRWVLPGDLASVQADGTIVLHGRGSGCINTGGEKVFPEEVEMVLKGHPAVSDALVVGLADDKWGQRVVAVVTPREGESPTGEALKQFAAAELSAYKLPKEWHFTDRVLRGTNGKPDYVAAKALVDSGHAPESASGSSLVGSPS